MIHPSIPNSSVRPLGFLRWEAEITVEERGRPHTYYFLGHTRKGAIRKAVDWYIWRKQQ